ncbi:hypothetical protein ACT3UA_11225 [Glutamicibacter sp. 363]|uniref:hypothetical protein n=1 Tax=Glutamicibacter sp. 363 TaxID=3457731 RepID=UPI004034DEE3
MASEATEHGATDSGLTMPKFGELDLEQLVNEPLLPELEPYLRHETAFGTSLHHPLVIEPFAVLSGLANRIYTSKTWALKKAIEDQDWSTVVFIHERPYRLEAFVEHVLNGLATPLVDLSPELKALATEIWSDSENHYEMKQYWDQLLSKRDGALLLADKKGLELYGTLPEELTVYRGDHEDSLRISWSLNRSTGEFFANRFNDRTRALLTGTVKKEHIFGIIMDRNEAEILVDMRQVNIDKE